MGNCFYGLLQCNSKGHLQDYLGPGALLWAIKLRHPPQTRTFPLHLFTLRTGLLPASHIQPEVWSCYETPWNLITQLSVISKSKWNLVSTCATTKDKNNNNNNLFKFWARGGRGHRPRGNKHSKIRTTYLCAFRKEKYATYPDRRHGEEVRSSSSWPVTLKNWKLGMG